MEELGPQGVGMPGGARSLPGSPGALPGSPGAGAGPEGDLASIAM